MKKIISIILTVVMLSAVVMTIPFGAFAVDAANAVASIGTTYYESLDDAIEAAQDGDVIVLLEDVASTGKTITGKKITIKGEGTTKPVITPGTGKGAFWVRGDVTFENIAFKNFASKNVIYYGTQNGTDSNTYKITVDNCEFEFSASGAIYGYNCKQAEIKVTNSSFTSLTGSSAHSVLNLSVAPAVATYTKFENVTLDGCGQYINTTAPGVFKDLDAPHLSAPSYFKSYDEAEAGELLYTVNFNGDTAFVPGSAGGANDKGHMTYTVIDNGAGVEIKAKDTAKDSEASLWGGIIKDLEATDKTIYSMVYKAKANGTVGKNNSVGVGGWVISEATFKTTTGIYNVYANHNTVDANGSTADQRAALSNGTGKIGSYVMVNTKDAIAVDVDGFVTALVVYDGTTKTFANYYLKAGATELDNESSWIKFEDQPMAAALGGNKNYMCFWTYTFYACIDTTIKDVQYYKEFLWPVSNGSDYNMSGDTVMTNAHVASVTKGGITFYYDTLSRALSDARENSLAEIVVLKDITIRSHAFGYYDDFDVTIKGANADIKLTVESWGISVGSCRLAFENINLDLDELALGIFDDNTYTYLEFSFKNVNITIRDNHAIYIDDCLEETATVTMIDCVITHTNPSDTSYMMSVGCDNFTFIADGVTTNTRIISSRAKDIYNLTDITATYLTEPYDAETGLTNTVGSVVSISYGNDATAKKFGCNYRVGDTEGGKVGEVYFTTAAEAIRAAAASVNVYDISGTEPVIVSKVCDHSYADTVVPPTCATEGYTEHRCSACGEYYKDTFVAALGHIYVAGQTTCTNAGCGEALVAAIGAVGYKSLADALAAVPENGADVTEITLIANATWNSAKVFTNKKVTIKGATANKGVTLTFKATATANVKSNATLNFDNLKIALATGSANNVFLLEGKGINLSFNNCDIENTHTAGLNFIRALAANTEVESLQFKNVNITAVSGKGIGLLATGGGVSPVVGSAEKPVLLENVNGVFYASAVYVAAGANTRPVIYLKVKDSDVSWTNIINIAAATATPTIHINVENSTIARTSAITANPFTGEIIWDDASAVAYGYYYRVGETAEGELGEVYFTTAAEAIQAAAASVNVYDISGTEPVIVSKVCDHSYSDTVVPPTCTANGYTVHTCSKCGGTYTDTPVAALGHNYSTATCTQKAKCSACGLETGTLANHSYSIATCTQRAKCSACGLETGALASHVDADANGKCDVCGADVPVDDVTTEPPVTTEPFTTSAPDTTVAPTTTGAPVTTTPPVTIDPAAIAPAIGDMMAGCNGTVGAAGLALVAALGSCAIFVEKKRK